MNTIPGKFQHALVIADLERKMGEVVIKTCAEKKNDNFAERCEDQEAIKNLIS